MEETQTKKWYDRTWLVVLLCIFFFPVGLYAIWKSRRIALVWKISYTVLLALALFLPRTEKEESTSIAQDKTQAAAPTTPAAPELTQQQKDSLAKAEKVAELEARKQNTVTAESLVQHYVNNEVRADGYFKDKRFYVEGIVSDIGKDILGNIYVTLSGPRNEFRAVQCYFNNPGLASQLDKGNKVAFLGTCTGLMMNVQMNDCDLVEGSWAMEKELEQMH
ncbi:MAG TPA: hypothetical protein PKD45_15535 [Flavobacteriales bacterium]|nr:hypothetical protein [Flavobacteriales bacterium]